MIKKLLTISAFFAAFSINAQSNLVAEPAGPLKRQAVVETPVNSIDAKTSAITTGDTLWYFLNKHYYRNAASVGYYTFPSPNTNFITHFGSRFTNSNPNLAITGLECVATRSNTSPSASVTVRMYLTNVVSGLPVFPALDSVTSIITGTTVAFLGGNFIAPKFVTGDYAVLYKCIPTVAGDAIRVWINNANTAASTTTVVGSKYGEGFGYLRAAPDATSAASFITTTGAFGAGTDYEFLVAPRVGFTASASAGVPTASILCTNTAYGFNNTTPVFPFSNRQYNQNEFYRHWKPFLTSGLMPDSVYVWNFGDATGNFYNNPSINHTYTSAGTFNGTLTANYQKMSDSGVKLADNFTFSKTVSTCAGIQSFSGIEAVNVYPNPSTGLVNIANLPSESTIEVVNMLGQSVYSAKANQANFTADLSTLSNGSYFVKISSVNEKTKIVKLILN
ncbi:MAG: T9SS type A sorting domain-containing protein [Bacteroidia bacterium]|nr:T9SS type A sorting domain-containing protein [Bacteroidia bacterium]